MYKRQSLPRRAVEHGPTTTSIAEAVPIVARLLGGGRTAMLTGAGVSVASGLASYRGKDGLYSKSALTANPAYSPIFFHEFVRGGDTGDLARRRYWARSFRGYPALQRAVPNAAHVAAAELLRSGHVSHLITQNVDRLHHAALGTRDGHPRITELHGESHLTRRASRCYVHFAWRRRERLLDRRVRVRGHGCACAAWMWPRAPPRCAAEPLSAAEPALYR